MTFFIKKKKKRDQLVGTRLSPRAFQYLSLYCLAHGTDKAKILRGLVDNWMLQKRVGNDSDSNLIKQITAMINSGWVSYKIVNKIAPEDMDMFVAFKYSTRDNLLRQGAMEEQVNEIMKGIKDDKRK